MQEKHLQDPAVLGLLNSLMSSYELPTLFSNEELEGLFQALAPSIKRDFPSEQIDPAQYFTARICQNLRVVLCVSPQNKLMEEHARSGSEIHVYTAVNVHVHLHVHV